MRPFENQNDPNTTLNLLKPIQKNCHPENASYLGPLNTDPLKCNIIQFFFKKLQRFSLQSLTQAIDPIEHQTSSCVTGPSL